MRKKELAWKVDPLTLCWNVTSHVPLSHGYIHIYREGRLIRAHRWMYEQRRGRIPEGICVLHKCDNPKCVNPDHLFLGTILDNSKDMYAKGRGRGYASLAPVEVQWIRKVYSEGLTTRKDLAEDFGVPLYTVDRILRKRLV